SPNGAFVAVNVGNGANKPKNSPFFNDYGLVKVLSVKGKELAPVTEAKVGHWCQGLAWSKDSRTLLAQCMVEKEIMVFRFDGKALKPAGSISSARGRPGSALRSHSVEPGPPSRWNGCCAPPSIPGMAFALLRGARRPFGWSSRR